MKALILVFSPSGNTKRIGTLLKACLEQNDISTQMIYISGNEEYFFATDKQSLLKEIVTQHDILLIGSPVYAHHLQYHVKDLIENLPRPKNEWGKVAIPFVTYGGINSGIALEEAGKLLRKSGRKVLAGLKVSSSHRMTRAFMEKEYNKDQPEDEIVTIIEGLVKHVKTIDLESVKDMSRHLRYQSRKTFLKANIIFNEKKWHQKRYPEIMINASECIKCGRCASVCPVFHLKQNDDNSTVKNSNTPCIHCFNCVLECPQRTIKPIGDLQKARDFMEKMIMKANENPGTFLYGGDQ